MISERLDLEVFERLAAWFVPHLPNAGLEGIVAWLSRQLDADENLQRDLYELLQLDDPRREEAEKAVAAMLERRFHMTASRWEQRDDVGRHVDWSRTYMEALTGVPDRFWNVRRSSVPDRALREALSGLARHWSSVLGASPYPHHAARADRLMRSLQHFGASRGNTRFGSAELGRLRRLGGAARLAADVIQEALIREAGVLPEDILHRALVALRRHGCLANPQVSTLDALLETTSRLAIARAAVDLGWALETVEPGRCKAFVATLTKSDLRCQISKDPPSSGDRYVSLRHRSGMLRDPSRARDSIPDVVLHFTSVSIPGDVYVLGDAKRNGTGDGSSYFRDSLRAAVYYQMAYADALGLEMGEGDVHSQVRPAFTLFFRQNARPPGETWAALRDGRSEDLPSLLCLDLETHLADRELEAIRSWFALVSDQAGRRLSEDGSKQMVGAEVPSATPA